MTELRLNTKDHIQIYVNDRLVGEVSVGQFDSRDTLLASVERSRRLGVVPKIVRAAIGRIQTIPNIEDHLHGTTVAKQQAYVRGLLDGFERKTTLFGDVSAAPEHSPAYRSGYETGENLSGLLASIDSLESV